jgi:hypothetical protein
MSAGDDILQAHEARAARRAPEEGKWRDIARLIAPDDAHLNPSSTQRREDEDIYDASPLYALDDFAAGVFTQATNPANRWFELTLGDKDLEKYAPVKQWLYSCASIHFASLAPSVSNFYAAAPAWFASLGAFGLGTLSQEERVGEGRISDRVVPLGQGYVELDGDGELRAYDNRFALRGDQLKPFMAARGGSVPGNVRDEATYVVVHATYRNPDYNPGRAGWQFMPWRGCYVSPDVRDLRVEGGFHELPYHPIFWSRRAGRDYPRGVGHLVLPDTATLNEMERTHLVAGQFAAEPPLMLRDESVLSAADIVPNAQLYGTMSERGEATAQYLERKGSLQLTLAQSQQKRDAIRTAFRFGLMQILRDRPQMTATEFLGFQQEGLELIGPNLISIQIGLAAFIARRHGILLRAGQLPPAPPELAGRSIGIEYASPLARAQKLSAARGVIQLQQSIEQMAVTDPSARDWFDADKAVPIVGEAFTNAPGVIRSDKAVEDLRRRRAAEVSQDVELDRLGKQVEIGATASHAIQAKTLADKRART